MLLFRRRDGVDRFPAASASLAGRTAAAVRLDYLWKMYSSGCKAPFTENTESAPAKTGILFRVNPLDRQPST
jgi:hypothetical protein